MPPAVIAAAVGGAASLAGAAISSSATSKASKAAREAAAENNRIQQAQLDRAYELQNPFVEGGYAGLHALYRQLGIEPPSTGASMTATGLGATRTSGAPGGANDWSSIRNDPLLQGDSFGPSGVDWARYVNENPDIRANWDAMTPQDRANFGNDIARFGQFHYQDDGARRDLTPFQSEATTETAQPGQGPLQAMERPDSPERPAWTPPTYGERPEVAAATQMQRPMADSRAATPERPPIQPTAAPVATGSSGSAFSSGSGSAGSSGSGSGGSAFSLPNAPNYGDRPEVEAFTYADRPDAPALDVSLNAFQESPDYQYRLNEASRGVLGKFGSMSALDSGAALKALGTRLGNEAAGEYGQWRDYTTGQRNFEATRGDANYSDDRNAAQAAWQARNAFTQQGYTDDANRTSGDWRAVLGETGALERTRMSEAGATERANISEAGASSRAQMAEAGTNSRYYAGLTQSAFENDRAFTEDARRYDLGRSDSAFADDRAFNESVRRYDTDLAQQAFEADRAFDFTAGVDARDYNNSNFNLDRAREDAIFADDRDYLTNRYDTYTDNAFRLAGLGANSANALTSAGQNYANAVSNNNNSAASATGNAALAGSANMMSLLGQGVNAFTYAFGRGGTGGGTTYGTSQTNPAYRGLGPYG